MFYNAAPWLSWWIFNVYLKRMCGLLLLGGLFYKCQCQSQVGWGLLYTNLLYISINYWERMSNFPTKIVHLSISACSAISFCFTYIESLLLGAQIFRIFFIPLMNFYLLYHYELILLVKKCFHDLSGSWNHGLEWYARVRKENIEWEKTKVSSRNLENTNI